MVTLFKPAPRVLAPTVTVEKTIPYAFLTEGAVKTLFYDALEPEK